MWTAPGAIGPADDLATGAIDARPVFDEVDAPPGRHELVAWLEVDAATLVAVARVEFARVLTKA